MSKAMELAKDFARHSVRSGGIVYGRPYSELEAELRRLADIEREHRAMLVNEQSLREELAALKASLSEPVRHEWRWLNPADAKVHPEELEWKTPMPKNLESQQEFINRLLVYRYNEKPVYEVRALYALTNKDQS